MPSEIVRDSDSIKTRVWNDKSSSTIVYTKEHIFIKASTINTKNT